MRVLRVVRATCDSGALSAQRNVCHVCVCVCDTQRQRGERQQSARRQRSARGRAAASGVIAHNGQRTLPSRIGTAVTDTVTAKKLFTTTAVGQFELI